MARTLASARRFVGRRVSRVCRRRVYRWFWAPAEQPLIDVALPQGFELTRGTEADLPLLAQVGGDFARAREFLGAGHRLWLVRRGDQVAFSGWIFLGSAPTDSVRTGWIPLGDGRGNHEDSNTHPDFRGQGLAALARQLMAAELAREGLVTHVFTGIVADNTASLRMTAKSSVWREFAVVEMTKIGLLRRDADWRNRYSDGPLTRTRIRISRPDVDGGPTPLDDEMYAWLRSATRAPVRGPGPAGEPAPEPAAALPAGRSAT